MPLYAAFTSRRLRPMLLLLPALLLCLSAVRVSAAGGDATLPAPPQRLVIPAIGVDAPVGAFDLNPDLSMPVPDTGTLVAWYSFSAEAGADGNAVLAGHRDLNYKRGVFYLLDDVQVGDDVWLQDSNDVWRLYRVVWTVSLPDGETPLDAVLGPTDTPSVTLITCSGDFNRGIGRYVERRMVRAELVPQQAADNGGDATQTP